MPAQSRTGFSWAILGKACVTYHGLKLDMPVRDPCGIPMGSTGHGPFDLSIGKPWACPYGASTGLSGGCPCPDRPRSTHGAPYKSRTGSDRERYLGNAYSESLVVGGGNPNFPRIRVRSMYKCRSMLINADQTKMLSILLDPTLIGIERNWSPLIGIDRHWDQLQCQCRNFDRHWALIEVVLNFIQFLIVYPENDWQIWVDILYLCDKPGDWLSKIWEV